MIAVLHSLPLPVRALRDTMRNVRRTVEGPFVTWRGTDNEDQQWRFYDVPEGAQTHYAAARLAGRSGADRLIVLAPVLAAPDFVEQEGTGFYQWLMPARIVSAGALEPLQRIMPANAGELPLPLPERLFSQLHTQQAASSAADVTLATLALPLTIPWLANELYLHYEAGLFDVSAAGAVAGAMDSGLDVHVFTWISGLVRPAVELPGASTNIGKEFEISLTELLRQTAAKTKTIL